MNGTVELLFGPSPAEPVFFEELKRLALSPLAEAFDDAIREIVLTVFYEGIGKLRNLGQLGRSAYLARLACEFTEHGALMLGLAHRFVYSTGPKMLEEPMHLAVAPMATTRFAI